MADPYSWLLLLAIMLTAAAAMLTIIRLMAGRPQLRQAARWCSGSAMALLIIAIAAHFVLGHSPGSTAALSVAGFAWAHPAPLIVLVAAIVLLGMTRLA